MANKSHLSIRVTQEEKARFIELGGADWLRESLKTGRAPGPSLEHDAVQPLNEAINLAMDALAVLQRYEDQRKATTTTTAATTPAATTPVDDDVWADFKVRK
jgi:hypothetical protein